MLVFAETVKLYVLLVLRVQHSSTSTQSWGSVLPSIVEKRDWGYPLFMRRGQKSFTPTAFEKLWTTPGNP